MSKPDMMDCSTCTHFERDDDGQVNADLWLGKCRRYPPTGKLTNNKPTFPSTLSNEWCGEYDWINQ